MSYTQKLLTVKRYGNGGSTIASALLETRATLERGTTLPTNWSKCKIALLLSVRGVDGTSSPVTEEMGADATLMGRYCVGLSDGNGMPGQTGTKYIGACLSRERDNGKVRVDSDYYNVKWCYPFGSTSYSSSNDFCAVAADGTNILYSGSVIGSGSVHCPMSGSDFASGLCYQLDASVAGELTVSYVGVARLTLLTCYDVDAALNSLLGATPTESGTLTNAGCWWDVAGGRPVGCSTLFVRFPYSLNRLIIHGYKVVSV